MLPSSTERTAAEWRVQSGPLPRLLMIDAVNAPSGQPDGVNATLATDDPVVRLGNPADPLARILGLLHSLPSVRELHIVCQGQPGVLQLGPCALTLEGVTRDERTRQTIAAIGRSLGAGGGIVIGGANAGHGTTGALFLQAIAELSGVEVSALVRYRPRSSVNGDRQARCTGRHAALRSSGHDRLGRCP